MYCVLINILYTIHAILCKNRSKYVYETINIMNIKKSRKNIIKYKLIKQYTLAIDY